MAAVTPDLSVEQISLLLGEGNLDVVLVLLLNVNPLEIVFLGSFNEILLSPSYLETAFEDNDADFIFVFIVFQRDVQLVLLVVRVLLRRGNQAKSEGFSDLLLIRGEHMDEVGENFPLQV